jgi:hypothetical protein
MSKKKKKKSDRQVYSEQSGQVTTTGSGETVWMPPPPEPEVFCSGFSQTEPLIDEEVLKVASELKPPVCPFPGRPDAGDKDPLVMSWYREHCTLEEYCRRYENRVVPQGEFMAPQTSGLFERPPSDFDDEEEPVKKPNVIMQ